MHYIQYEELCRLFVAKEENISIKNIKSDYISSAIRPGLEEYKNQIDLYWELDDKLTRNLVIVNVKWRSSDKDKVDKNDILLIQQVKQEFDANKAMIITNTGFTDGARKVAINRRIALHIVRPDFDITILDSSLKDRKAIQTQLTELSDNGKEIYSYEIIHRDLDTGTDGTVHTSVHDKTNIQTREIKQAPENRMAQTTSNRGTPPSNQKVQTRDGGSRSGRQSTPKSGRQGGPPSGRQGGSSGPPKGSGSTRGGGGSSNRGR